MMLVHLVDDNWLANRVSEMKRGEAPTMELASR